MRWELLALGFTSLIHLKAVPVYGQTASFSGSVTYQSPSKALTTITGQMTLPENLYYSGAGTINYEATGTANTDNFQPTSLTLTPAAGSVSVVDPSASISRRTSDFLQQAINNNDVPTAISIIRAAGGADGLE